MKPCGISVIISILLIGGICFSFYIENELVVRRAKLSAESDIGNKYDNRRKHYSNSYKTVLEGDSVKLEYEKDGDTLITHYIYLPGTSGKTGFDDSYDYKQFFTTIICDSDSKATYSYKINEFKIGFNKEEVKEYCDSILYITRQDTGRKKETNDYLYLKDKLKERNPHNDLICGDEELRELGKRFRPVIYYDGKKINAKKLLVVNWSTQFSWGTNFYFVDGKNDTLNIGKGVFGMR